MPDEPLKHVSKSSFQPPLFGRLSLFRTAQCVGALALLLGFIEHRYWLMIGPALAAGLVAAGSLAVARRRAHGERELATPRLYMITIPGLEVKSDWRVVHDRLLDAFSGVDEVLPTTTSETLLIVYRGQPQVDEWLEAVSEGVSRAFGRA